jgi:hypothetical protein
MRCLRIYATADSESHFGEVDIAMTTTPLFPNEAPFELSATIQRHGFVLYKSRPGCAKPAFTPRRIGSSPYGWMATWNSKQAMER